MSTYYNNRYFSWQKKAGVYGAEQDTRFYLPFINESDVVLDFGCGGGYILEALPGRIKYGVDVNEKALSVAQKKGIRTYTSLASLPRNIKFDVIITHHTLEHVDNPHQILKQFQTYLKPKGILVGILPIDDWRSQKNYRMRDINNHLYTWTPLLLRNLLASCGYHIVDIHIITAAWLPLSRYYFTYTPKPLYYLLSAIWSVLIRSRQLQFVVTRKV